MKKKSFKERLSSLSMLSVKARLIGVLGLLCAMLVGGAVIGLGAMHMQNEGARQIYEEQMVPADLTSSIRQHSLTSYIVLGEAYALIAKPEQMQQKIDAYSKSQAELDAQKTLLNAVPKSGDVAKLYKEWLDTGEEMAADSKELLQAFTDKDAEAALDLLEMQMRPLMLQRQETLAQIIKLKEVSALQIFQEQVRRYQFVRAITVIALLAGLLLALIIGTLLVRSIIGTLNHAVQVANAIAAGKLGHDIKVRRKDELGELLLAFRSMDERLSLTVGEVRSGSDAVSTAAQQIARGNDDLSQRTQEQASSLEETASSMEEMTSTVKQNAENASHANQLARGAREQAERGGEVAGRAIIAMSEINASSSKIADIVGLIQEIAFQTNLLALNAAVEAARAGEQGRGFAVVATEVRSLAQRSAGAAKEIKGLITDSAEKVRSGSELVNQSGKALAEIVDSVKKVTDIVAEIAAASQEQSAGIDQVNNAVMQMDEMTQQNAALVEEAAAAARAMQEQAAELTEQVGFFKLSESATLFAATSASTRAQSAVSETEAVLAAVRSSAPAPARTARALAEPSGATGVWKEF